MNRWRWGLIGGAAALIAAGGAFVINERSVEQPRYTVLERDGAIELRAYPALLVAETFARGERERALGQGFHALARYIFAGDRPGARIAMTAPVLSDDIGGDWRTRFVMPAAWTRATLPKPAGDVRIAEMPARRVAVIRFAGTAGDHVLADRTAALRAWMTAHGIVPGAVGYAFYNSPFMPGPLRRNEVMIAID